MRTNFTGRMNRDVFYGDGGGYYPSPEHTEQPYIDQRSWFDKLWDKTPAWLKAFVILFSMCLVTLIVCVGLIFLSKVMSPSAIFTVVILGFLYSAIYFAVKNS